jgi:hypothetical protein
MLSLGADGDGLTGSLQRWGRAMRAVHHTKRAPDIVLSHLSFWTDNGAYYYLYGGHPERHNAVCDTLAHGPMDDIVLRLVNSWAEQELPVRSLQLDDWWYIGGELDSHDHMCVKKWEPKGALWPRGLPALPAQISYNLYAPFYCEDNAYRRAFPFANSTFEKVSV